MGQGANQCLQDGAAIGMWFALVGGCGVNGGPQRKAVSSLKTAVTDRTREMVQRTAPIVAASRDAAAYWHSAAA